MDQYERVQSFVAEQFWYIFVELSRPAQDERGEAKGGNKPGKGGGGGVDIRTSFTWRRGHLFDWQVAVVLYEQCVERPLATVTRVITKPSSRWCVTTESTGRAIPS